MLSKTEFSDLVKVSLGRLTHSKCFFNQHIAYQSYKLTAELHFTRKNFLFILENLKLIKNSYDNISKILFIPYPTPKFVKTPQQRSLFLLFLKRFSKFKILHDQVWNQISRDLL